MPNFNVNDGTGTMEHCQRCPHFVCISNTVWQDRYVWCTGGGHMHVRLKDHQRWAIAKIWQWWGRR